MHSTLVEATVALSEPQMVGMHHLRCRAHSLLTLSLGRLWAGNPRSFPKPHKPAPGLGPMSSGTMVVIHIVIQWIGLKEKLFPVDFP